MIATKQKTTTVSIDGGDYNPYTEPKNGIQRLIGSFIKQLQRSKNNKIRFDYLYFGNRVSGNSRFPIRYRNVPSRFFSSVFIPLSVISSRSKIFLAFAGVLPQLIRMTHTKTIVFIHDFGFIHHPDNYHDPVRMKWQTEYALYGADKIVVFSEYIRNQIRQLYSTLPSDKVIRIYPGADHLPLVKKKTPLRPYFLYVGVIKKTKNLESLFCLFQQYQIKTNDKNTLLYLIGNVTPYWNELQKTSSYISVKDQVRLISNLSDKKLSEYYQNAVAFINISHDEGFCYPVIESLTKGIPTFVNSIPLYDEFLTYFPNLFILKKQSDFIVKMEMAIHKKISCKQNVKHPFTWNMFTQELFHVINKLSQ